MSRLQAIVNALSSATARAAEAVLGTRFGARDAETAVYECAVRAAGLASASAGVCDADRAEVVEYFCQFGSVFVSERGVAMAETPSPVYPVRDVVDASAVWHNGDELADELVQALVVVFVCWHTYAVAFRCVASRSVVGMHARCVWRVLQLACTWALGASMGGGPATYEIRAAALVAGWVFRNHKRHCRALWWGPADSVRVQVAASCSVHKDRRPCGVSVPSALRLRVVMVSRLPARLDVPGQFAIPCGPSQMRLLAVCSAVQPLKMLPERTLRPHTTIKRLRDACRQTCQERAERALAQSTAATAAVERDPWLLDTTRTRLVDRIRRDTAAELALIEADREAYLQIIDTSDASIPVILDRIAAVRRRQPPHPSLMRLSSLDPSLWARFDRQAHQIRHRAITSASRCPAPQAIMRTRDRAAVLLDNLERMRDAVFARLSQSPRPRLDAKTT